jgi:hypothetical protein
LYGRSGRTLACIPTVHACRVCDCTYFDTDDPRSCTPVRYVMGPRPTLTCSARWATERLPPSRGHDNLAWGGGAGRGAADRPSPRGGELRAQRRTGGTAALAAGGARPVEEHPIGDSHAPPQRRQRGATGMARRASCAPGFGRFRRQDGQARRARPRRTYHYHPPLLPGSMSPSPSPLPACRRLRDRGGC